MVIGAEVMRLSIDADGLVGFFWERTSSWREDRDMEADPWARQEGGSYGDLNAPKSFNFICKPHRDYNSSTHHC